jgi:pyruvate/2-oxoglutarate dehydrogenase complex dihydrolipoamide dehydrogenase (E3) component
VTLYEAANQLGGQALLAQQLPRRGEFGGIATNLAREVELANVRVRRGVRVDRALVEAEKPDAVILATGARPYRPDIPIDDSIQVVDAWQVLRKEVKTGSRVVVVDWRCDWIGPGIAELLTNEGCSVDLAVNGTHPGELLPLYVRDNIAAELHRIGVRVTPYARLYGGDSGTVYMQHTTSDQPILFEDVETLVLCLGHEPVDDLGAMLRDLVPEVHIIGDSLAPRTAEEAVYEGLKVASAL